MTHYIVDYLIDSERDYVNQTGAPFFKRHSHRRFSAETKDQFIQFLLNLNTNDEDLCLTILSHGYVSTDLSISGIVKDDRRENLILWREILDSCNQIRTNNQLILNVLHPCKSCHIMDNYKKYDLVDFIWYSQDENATVNHALRAALEFYDFNSFIADISQDENVLYFENIVQK